MVHTVIELLDHLLATHADELAERDDSKVGAHSLRNSLELSIKYGSDRMTMASDDELLPQIHQRYESIHRAIHQDATAATQPEQSPAPRPEGEDWKERAREFAIPTLNGWLAAGRLSREDHVRWVHALEPTENLAPGVPVEEGNTLARLAWWMTVDRIALGQIVIESEDLASVLDEHFEEVSDALRVHTRHNALSMLGDWLAQGRISRDDYNKWTHALEPTENLSEGQLVKEADAVARVAWFMTVDRIAAGQIDIDEADLGSVLAEHLIEASR